MPSRIIGSEEVIPNSYTTDKWLLICKGGAKSGIALAPEEDLDSTRMLRNSISARISCNLPQPSSLVCPTTLVTNASNQRLKASRLFHTSPLSHETARRQASRLKKSKYQTKRADNARKVKDNRPHPALGYGPGKEALWTDSKLCKLLITEDQVQKLPVPALTLTLEPERVKVKGLDGKYKFDLEKDTYEMELTDRMVPKVVNGRAVVQKYEDPEVYNYGVGPREVGVIGNLAYARGEANMIRFEEFVASQGVLRRAGVKTQKSQIEDKEHRIKMEEEQDRQSSQEKSISYWFGRLLDIKNASAQGLEFENKKRIVAAFSSRGKAHDPGLPEVQAALKTYRIHVLWDHLQTKKNDIHNRRRLVMMIQERAKILHYLRQTYRTRYEALLPELGLERGAVEGQLQLTRQLTPA